MARAYTNPWGFGSPVNDDPPRRSRGATNGTGRKGGQFDDEPSPRNDRRLVMPLEFIGPAIDAVGAFQEPDVIEYTKIEGEKAKPSPLTPPDIKMSEEQLRSLANYLERELSLCESERLPYIRKLARLKFKYRTEFPEVPKNWPVANASQITIPVIKTAVDTINSRVYQTVMAAEPLMRVKTEDEEFTDFAFDFEEFLQMYGQEKLDLETLYDPWITELVILGTAVTETTNWREQKSVAKYDPSTGTYHKETVVCHNGPMIFHFPIEDYWQRPGFQDPQRAPWCGKELRLSWSEIKNMAFSGELNPEEVIKIAKTPNQINEVPDTVKVDEQLDKFIPNQQDIYTLYELCVRWDVDGDGLEEEIIVYYHRGSRTFLRRKFNNFYKGRRPWTITQFKKIPHRLYGEGVAEMLEHLQEEISTIHNQRIDNATIANLRIILVSKLIQGLKPGDRLWSGKIVKVTDVARDVGTLQLGEVYPSTVNNEQIAQSYVREVSGASEAAMGQAQPVSRTTATAQMALLEELNRRFDKPLRNIRRSIRDQHRMLADLFLEQGTGGLAEQWLGTQRGRSLEAFLMLPPDLVNKKLKMALTATKSSNNREVDFQTQVAVMQLIIQNGNQLLSMVQGLAPQATAMVAHELVATIRPVFRKVMAYAEAGDPDAATAVLDVVERILPAPEDMGGMDAARAQEAARMAAGGGPGSVPGPQGGPPAPAQVQGQPGMASPPTLPQPPNGPGAVPAGGVPGY